MFVRFFDGQIASSQVDAQDFTIVTVWHREILLSIARLSPADHSKQRHLISISQDMGSIFLFLVIDGNDYPAVNAQFLEQSAKGGPIFQLDACPPLCFRG
jgi:hypothetical protein